MRLRSLTLLLAACCPLTSLLSAATTAEAKPVALFDGTTLGGWEGDAKYWRVQDGSITGEIPAGQKLGGNQFIWWQGEVADFDLVLEYRITGDPSANSGIQFRAEFFNLFNHVNLGAPGLNIRDPDNFGRVTSTNQGAAGMPGDARVVQFGLKFAF